uniref:Nucleoprotein n=1 Tax=Pelargonium radula virus 1 TaxID=2793734 RepID=A0A8D9PGT9_9RHAB|nr:TPA_asm: N [Pelargonium radula virus 1]
MSVTLTAQEREAIKASLAVMKSKPSTSRNVVTTAPRNITRDVIKPAAGASKGKEEDGKKASAPVKRISRFGDLESVTVSLSTRPKPWKDAEIKSIKITEVTQLSITEAIAIGTEMMGSIRAGKVTSQTVDQILSLAVSIFSPSSINNEASHLLNPLPDKLGTIIRQSETEPTKPSEVAAGGLMEQLEKVRSRINRAKAGADVSKLRELEDRLNGQLNNLETGAANDRDQINNVDDAYAYTYLAAYMMRLAGKTSAAWVDRLEMAKTRFHSWYDCESSILDHIDVEAEQAERIREGMARRPDSISTWVLWAAYNENENSLMNQNDSGMLRYLVTQMYSYTGMHAYASVMQLQVEHNVTFKFLLEELNCPVTRKAVYEIADIIRNHEITEQHSDRKTYFRYARVWDSGFFVNLQSKNCTVLGYTVAKARKMLSSSTTLSDPTQAFAFKNLDEKIKSSLDTVADRLYEKIMAVSTQDEESGSIWKA